jgi:hypothetical protein
MASPSNSSGSSWRPGAVRGLPKYKIMVVFRRYARNCTHPPVKVIINNYKLILQAGEPQLHVSLYLGTEYWQI